MNVNPRNIIAVAAAVFLVMAGVYLVCSPRDIPPAETVITINDHRIPYAEYQRLLKEQGLDMPSAEVEQAFIDNLIRQKLVLQEAQRIGLDRDPEFLATVQRFWEQSLMRVMMEKKLKELQSRPAGHAPNDLRPDIDRWLEELRDNARVKINGKVLKD
ncbi:MAG: SurA N-terminal domain-containing protein [Candidatus Omnitrophica bacterium]|nr:SurA N-terminal domain-containing protein [Candidatus Omnitrophota bacterium]